MTKERKRFLLIFITGGNLAAIIGWMLEKGAFPNDRIAWITLVIILVTLNVTYIVGILARRSFERRNAPKR